jgi:hypothetical protein
MGIAASAQIRRMGPISLACALAALFAGCAPTPAPAPELPPIVEFGPEVPAWLGVATPADTARIEHINALWADGLTRARRAGFRHALAVEGALLDPRVSLPRAMPPPGPYRCRIVRLGGFGRGRPFSAFRPYFCHVVHEGDLLSLTKQEGAERPGGFLWDDGPDRMIFLGAMALGNEPMPLAYGDDPGRDLIGVVERVGAFRYRVAIMSAIPGRLDVMELVPSIPEP